MSLVPSQSWSINDWADYWRYQIGLNVIPADTRNKIPLVRWTPYQNIPILEEQHNQWKQENTFAKGIAIIVGKVWHNDVKNGLYLTFVDLDNKKAIEEFCTRDGKSVLLDDLAKHMIIEQHRDEPDKAHAYFYSRHPFKKKSSDSNSNNPNGNEIPAIEVKGLGEHGLAFCSPSPHRNGHNYEIIGTPEPEIIDDLELHIDNICRKYHIPYLETSGDERSLVPIQELFKDDTKIYEGHNRHEALLRVMESLISRNRGILNLDQIESFAHQWNLQHCSPPLVFSDVEKQWNDAVKFIQRCEVRNREQANNNDVNELGLDGNAEQKENNNNNNNEPSENQAQSNAELLVRLAHENVQLFFKDQYGAAFGLVNVSDHRETVALESSRFRRFLAKIFYDKNNHKVVSTDAITNTIQILQAKTEYESKTIPLHVRIASPNPLKTDNKSIYYDLTDEKWRCIKISKESWQIVSESPGIFVRYNQIPQVEPEREYESGILDKFTALTNIKDSDGLLLKVYIISLFIPDIPHAMLILHGEKGSAKSTLQTLIKMLVDPSKPTLFTVHNDRNEFIQQLAHNHVAFYDNLKRTPGWLSDEACKAVTGVGQTKRKLYTNDEDFVYEYKRCLGFNGINVTLTEPDALDRSIMIELERITKESRKLESDIFAEFEQLRPRLLGYIFDTLVKTLQIIEGIKLDDLPRMADFALWGEAIARAMSHEPLEFINAYYENIGKQNIEAVEANPLGQAIVKLCDALEESNQIEWFSSTTECLEKLNEVAALNKINTDSRSWPKASNSLSRAINRIRSNLLEGLGIDISISRTTSEDPRYKKNTSTIKIRKISPLPPLPPPDENQARF